MMNDLDNLKSTWKTISDAGSKKGLSGDELRKIVNKRSNNELLKIRRKIIMEWSIAFVLSVMLVLIIHFINAGDTKYALMFIGLILAISFFPYLNVIRLNFTSHSDLKNYLNEFIVRFNKLVNQYIKMASIMIPVAGLGGFLLGVHSTSGQNEWNGFFNWQNMILLILFVSVISLAGYWVQHRYFKWIYGKNIQRLKDCLADLNEVE